jgi:hypothetical protein
MYYEVSEAPHLYHKTKGQIKNIMIPAFLLGLLPKYDMEDYDEQVTSPLSTMISITRKTKTILMMSPLHYPFSTLKLILTGSNESSGYPR